MDASGQEPLQLATQAPKVHGLLHLQQVPCAAYQGAHHHPVKGQSGPATPYPFTGDNPTSDRCPGAWLSTMQHHPLVNLQHLFVQYLGHGHCLGAGRGSEEAQA